MKHYQNKTTLSGEICDINTTPLVDVMLVLLIIFMITAPMPQNFSHAKIPIVGDGDGKLPTLLTLDIAPAGNGALLMLNDQPITLSRLGEVIKANNASAKPPELNLRTDPATSYAAVARVLATIQLSGGKNVRFDELSAR